MIKITYRGATLRCLNNKDREYLSQPDKPIFGKRHAKQCMTCGLRYTEGVSRYHTGAGDLCPKCESDEPWDYAPDWRAEVVWRYTVRIHRNHNHAA